MIETDKVPIMETWRALEELVDEGVVRSIGVSNFSTQLLYDLLSYARHSVSSLQIEHHPYLVQDTLVTMAQEEGIAITGYSTFGPQSFMELPPSFRARAENVPMLFDHPVIQKIAKAHRTSPGQVLLRWATQRQVQRVSERVVIDANEVRGIAVIPKSNNKARLQQNLEVNNVSLEKAELEEISALDRGLRFNDPGFYLKKPIRIFD